MTTNLHPRSAAGHIVPDSDLVPVRTVVWNRMASGNGKHVESTRWTLRLPSVLPSVGESHSPCQAAPAGQPVAAGDQQISDVAVMPLMKLTQRSLPHCGPPRGRKHSYSPPTGLHVSAQCVFDLMAP